MFPEPRRRSQTQPQYLFATRQCLGRLDIGLSAEKTVRVRLPRDTMVRIGELLKLPLIQQHCHLRNCDSDM